MDEQEDDDIVSDEMSDVDSEDISEDADQDSDMEMGSDEGDDMDMPVDELLRKRYGVALHDYAQEQETGNEDVSMSGQRSKGVVGEDAVAVKAQVAPALNGTTGEQHRQARGDGGFQNDHPDKSGASSGDVKHVTAAESSLL